ncbi:MAG: hypothetical protein ACOY9Y_11065 [Bacillota bacterium]
MYFNKHNLAANRSWHWGLIPLIMLGLLASLTGCVRMPVKQVSISPVQTYFPSGVNSEWDYEGRGSEYADFQMQVLEKQGNRALFVRADAGTTLALVYDITPDQITLVYSEENFEGDKTVLTAPPNRQDVILNGPVEAGTTWKAGDRTYKIEKTGVTVVTPVGTFKDCIQVRVTFPAGEHEIIQYYAPNVGMVKSEFIAGNSSVVSTLKSYKIKP